MRVETFCLSRLGQDFVWGRADCAHFAAAWAVAGLGAKPVPLPRFTANGARRASLRPARLSRVARHWARRAGLALARGQAMPGDIGVIEFEDATGFGVFTGLAWAVPAQGGFGLVDAAPRLLLRAT